MPEMKALDAISTDHDRHIEPATWRGGQAPYAGDGRPGINRGRRGAIKGHRCHSLRAGETIVERPPGLATIAAGENAIVVVDVGQITID